MRQIRDTQWNHSCDSMLHTCLHTHIHTDTDGHQTHTQKKKCTLASPEIHSHINTFWHYSPNKKQIACHTVALDHIALPTQKCLRYSRIFTSITVCHMKLLRYRLY